MLNGALRDIAVLLAVYELTSNRRNNRLYRQQWGDGAALRRLQHCAPYPLVEKMGCSTWRITPYARHWLRNFRDINLLQPRWWEFVGGCAAVAETEKYGIR